MTDLVEKYENVFPIFASDYIKEKKAYDKYLELFDRILNAEKEEELEECKKQITAEMPWKNAFYENNEFKSIADTDRKILKPMLDYEKKAVDEFIKNEAEKEAETKTKNKTKKYNGTADDLFKKLFNDFEHAFDGNFENPKVIILGINPKISDIDHDSYDLQRVYEEPFDEYRGTLFSENPKKNDYYFSKTNGLFFKGLDTSDDKRQELYQKFMTQVNCKKKETPFALWEFFPYASQSEKVWHKDVPIALGAKGIKQFFDLERILPSQIWMLCLLTYTIKKSIIDEKQIKLFLRKNNEKFRQSFLDSYFELLNWKDCVTVLTKKNGRNKEFTRNNISEKDFFGRKHKICMSTDEEFFKFIWEIKITNKK